eukprot:CAMPEP_0113542832 /NCGR_PEP_ID=MMETSP0015_2-20120614/9827_1 /TAXON_ID=2838 /ORGANISM="Odontella" /LENGTH=640 /DNA_ID=CAMNT_0000442935 /DNA_START=80 /DNA_END=1999 /DNA_ORIENTATION=+ /assembly_acc=CAM_ASM_000160
MRVLILLVLCLSPQHCRSFSASVADRKRKLQPGNRHGPFRIDWSFFPNHVPSVNLLWNQTSWKNYLRIHQSVGKRKSFRRIFQIALTLSSEILRPLVCNFVKGPRLAASDWDAFWSRRIRGKTSNAQRVAQGFQQLGPTFVKLGQAMATRPDILNVQLANELANLQDNMTTFDNRVAKRIIRRDLAALTKDKSKRYAGNTWDSTTLESFMGSLSAKPVAAASIAQVYKGTLPGYGDVAVKVQRPRIRKKVELDATLFHSAATWMESLKWPSGTPMHGERLVGSMKIVSTVDEFTTRVFEEMDFEREAKNIELFGRLYSHKRGSSKSAKVVVPEVFPELSGRRVLVMEWIEGKKLTNICDSCEEREEVVKENLVLVKKSIEFTLSQLIDTGILHADPHAGNLLKVPLPGGKVELGYLDYGLISNISQRVRDGIVCAVVQLVFARNIEAVADLLVDLEMIPEERMMNPIERKELVDALKQSFDDILLWPKDENGRSTAVPKVRFENLISSLTSLISVFEFTVPPYFLNNARALATLEGMALKLDPDFNILRVIYPYSINRLMRNPSVGRLAEEQFLEICRSPDTKLFDLNRSMMLLNDWALLTGYRKRKVFWDLATSAGGRRVSRRIIREWYLKRVRRVRQW